jgi:hypothetical protein
VLRLTPVNTTNGLAVTWPSAEGRYYRLLGTTNLLAGFAEFVRTNLSATPPMNLETNLSPSAVPARFYRLEIEP